MDDERERPYARITDFVVKNQSLAADVENFHQKIVAQNDALRVSWLVESDACHDWLIGVSNLKVQPVALTLERQ